MQQAGEVPRTRSVWQAGEGMSLDSTFYVTTLSFRESLLDASPKIQLPSAVFFSVAF